MKHKQDKRKSPKHDKTKKHSKHARDSKHADKHHHDHHDEACSERAPDHRDAELVLRLYDLRREPVMRASRLAIVKFLPRSYDDVAALIKPDHPDNAAWRQVSSYFEMAYSFARNGIVPADSPRGKRRGRPALVRQDLALPGATARRDRADGAAQLRVDGRELRIRRDPRRGVQDAYRQAARLVLRLRGTLDCGRGSPHGRRKGPPCCSPSARSSRSSPPRRSRRRPRCPCFRMPSCSRGSRQSPVPSGCSSASRAKGARSRPSACARTRRRARRSSSSRTSTARRPGRARSRCKTPRRSRRNVPKSRSRRCSSTRT
jgi:hypothetical protein